MSPIILTRKHYKKLRWYFAHTYGGPSIVDTADLDLCALGLVERIERHGSVMFKMTQLGINELSEENRREVERRKPHHSLAERLAQWLRDQGRMTWENVEFLVEVESYGQIGKRPARPDVFSVCATLNAANLRPLVHEVKVSRSDFLADLAKPEKRGAYSTLADCMYYVAPTGIIKPEECPPECGLVIEGDEGFSVVKKPKRKAGLVQLTPSHFMNMVLKPGTVNPLV